MEILVIGNGLAGLSATIEGAKKGAKVTLVSQNSMDRSQSVMAEGGINAALNTKGEEDSTAIHMDETLTSACGLTSEQGVRDMTAAAPDIIKYLSQIGVVFSRDEQGREDLRAFGGQSKRRTVYSKSGIGRQIVTAMSQEVRKYAAQGHIHMKEHHRFAELLIDGEECLGAIVQDIHTGRYEVLVADATIMATGGMNGLFGETTGSYLSDGIATATAFRQGVEMANLEMIQYHPTTVLRGEKRLLISEAARGEGGRLFVYKSDLSDESHNGREKWYFMEELYPEKGNLMSRDVVSQTMESVSKQYGQVYLDLTHIPKQILEINLKEVCDTCRTYLQIEPSKDYIPVSPGIHYFMGGFYVDESHRCSVKGLYAAGECACQYHGANRLGGNSTLGAIYGGMKSVNTVLSDLWHLQEGVEDAFKAADIKRNRLRFAETQLDHVQQDGEKILKENQKKRVQNILKKGLGIVRDNETLVTCLEQLKAINAVEQDNMILLAEAMLKSALERKETRGAHVREDYPDKDDANFLKMTVVSYSDNGNVRIRLEDI